jgi:hypothetical protein
MTDRDPGALARGEYADRYLEQTPTHQFDWRVYLGLFDARLLGSRAGRRNLTKYRPVLFALIYLRPHLTDRDTGATTLAGWHVEWLQRGLDWCVPVSGDTGPREADIAPRESGKTTMHYLARIMWAAAHRHRRFVAAFSDTATQAEDHLATFRTELSDNALIREDYSDLTRAARYGVGAIMANRKGLYIAQSGFVFAARGMDTAVLGMKIGDKRPDVLLFDDIEPKASNYSLDQKAKRLASLTDAILPLALSAHVQIVGTVVMPGSIIHDLVLKGKQRRGEQELDEGEIERTEWVDTERFTIHHYRALVPGDDPSGKVSAWGAKWSTPYLLRIEGTRSYQLNYDNDPVDFAGSWWSTDDITILPEGCAPVMPRQLLSIDPAVTTKDTSDYTGLAVVGYEPEHRRCVTLDVRAVRVAPGAELRTLVVRILALYPGIGAVRVETNQGGDAWRAILHDLPVKILYRWTGESKDSRFLRLLGHHQRGRVVWIRRFASYLTQLVTHPGPHDDMIDAEAHGVDELMQAAAGPGDTGRRRRAPSYVR